VDAVLERMLCGVSTRRFSRTQEPVGAQVADAERSTSKSAVSREFVARTTENLAALMARRLDDVRLAVLMLDGIELKGHTNIVALGITTEGVKVALGLWEGSTENAAVATALLADLVARGLDTAQGVLVVIDGAKALRKASATCSASGRRSSAASVTRSAMWQTTSPSATARRSGAGCGRRGRSSATRQHRSASRRSPRSSSAPTPVPRRRFGRGSPRR
jgi:transposase-like protein